MNYLRRGFIFAAVLSIIIGIIKITVAAMFTAWSSDFSGFHFVIYTPEITGAAFSGVFDLCFSLLALVAIVRNDFLLMYVFCLNMVPVSLAKAAHVYLCYTHMHSFKSILRREVGTLWIKYNYIDDAVAITDRVQTQFKCCGAYESSSWLRDNLDRLPKSCCVGSAVCTMNNSFRRGCYQALLERVKFEWMNFLLFICVPTIEGIMMVTGCVYTMNEL